MQGSRGIRDPVIASRSGTCRMGPENRMTSFHVSGEDMCQSSETTHPPLAAISLITAIVLRSSTCRGDDFGGGDSIATGSKATSTDTLVTLHLASRSTAGLRELAAGYPSISATAQFHEAEVHRQVVSNSADRIKLARPGSIAGATSTSIWQNTHIQVRRMAGRPKNTLGGWAEIGGLGFEDVGDEGLGIAVDQGKP